MNSIELRYEVYKFLHGRDDMNESKTDPHCTGCNIQFPAGELRTFKDAVFVVGKFCSDECVDSYFNPVF